MQLCHVDPLLAPLDSQNSVQILIATCTGIVRTKDSGCSRLEHSRMNPEQLFH